MLLVKLPPFTGVCCHHVRARAFWFPSIKGGGGGLNSSLVLRTQSGVATLLITHSIRLLRDLTRCVFDQARLVDNEICQGKPSRRPRGSKRRHTRECTQHGRDVLGSFPR